MVMGAQRILNMKNLMKAIAQGFLNETHNSRLHYIMLGFYYRSLNVYTLF